MTLWKKCKKQLKLRKKGKMQNEHGKLKVLETQDWSPKPEIEYQEFASFYQMKRQEQEKRGFQKTRIAKGRDFINFAVTAMSLANAFLLLTGSKPHVALGMSMISVKLLSIIEQGDIWPLTVFNARTSLVFAGLAFIFDSRSMGRCGGVILAFTDLMAFGP